MKEIATIRTDILAMSSREIADLVDSRHDSVKRAIERLVERGVIASPPMVEKPTEGRPATEYVFSGEQGKRDSIVVVAQLSPEFTARLVDRWQELEAAQAAPSLDTDEGKLLMIQNLATKQLALIQENKQIAAERDQAVATKAQIGSRREATAMATAAKARREAEQLRAELGRNQHYATIIAVERATGTRMAKNAYVALRRWCRANRVEAVDVTDARYGTVKAWPAAAWLHVHAIDLSRLFAGERAAA